jgi:hypothetical protein
MGRFTAWMASRRKAQRRAAGASAGRAARSLGFERCEQRIALSTNAGYELPHLRMEAVGEQEGGFIVLASGVDVHSANVRFALRPYVLFGSDAQVQNDGGGVTLNWISPRRDVQYGYQLDSDAIQGDGPALSGTRYLGSSGGLTSALAPSGSFDSIALDDLGFSGFGPPGVLISESSVVPIPPPVEPGANEGGQISMIPFIGPSMFSLPTASESQLAVRTRHALAAEELESTPTATAQEAVSLRGRAVVYEVAQARPLADAEETSAVDRAFGERADDDRALKLFDSATASRDAAGEHVTRRQVSAEPPGAGLAAPAERAVTEAVFVRAANDEQTAPDDKASAGSAEARPVSARDAAFDELDQEMGPLEEQRQAAAATADANQRRIVGGALIAVAAVPILKAVRRTGRQVEIRPRRAAHGI